MNTINGNFTGEPLFYHRYIGVFFSAPISWLYRITPHIPWYPICLQLVIFISLTFILWSFITISLKNNVFVGFPVLGYIIVILTLGTIAIAQLDFTRTTALPAVTAIVLLMTIDFNSKKKTVAVLILSVLFLLLSASIRFQMLLPIMILYVAIFLCRLFWKVVLEKNLYKKIILPSLIIVICACLVVCVGNLLSDNIKQSVESAENTQLIDLVTNYRDYPHVEYEDNKELYESIGWSESYYNLVNRWCFFDGKVNLKSMEKLKSENDAVLNKSFSDTIKDIKEYYRVPYLTTRYALFISIILTVLILISLVYKCMVGKVKFSKFLSDITVLAGTWVSYIVMLFYLFYMGRFKEHAFFGVCAPLLVITIILLLRVAFVRSERHSLNGKNVLIILNSVFYIVLSIVMLFTVKNYAFNAYRYVYNEEYIKGPIQEELDTSISLEKYARDNPDKFLICDMSMYMWMISAYQDNYMSKCNLTMWGDSTYSTYPSRKQFEINGVEYYTSDSLFEDNVFYLTKNECDKDLLKYMREEYGKNVKAELTYSDKQGHFNVYHFVNSVN